MDDVREDNERGRNFDQERTDSAHKRTLLAEERTYTAWVRTGLASLATGFAIAKFMTESGPAWLIHLLGGMFIITGDAMILIGFWAYRSAIRRMQRQSWSAIPVWVVGVLTAMLVMGATIGLALIAMPARHQ